jgi:hypothetical protein
LNQTNLEIKSLARDEKAHPLIVGNRVFDVLPTTDDLINFTRKQYLFLQLIWRGLSTGEASEKAGYALDQAASFLETDKAKDYLQKKQLASIIAQETKNEDNWWVEVHQVRTGEKILNKGQMVALQASGDRVAPKRNEVNQEKTKVVINFNFSAESVKEAFKRQESIDAELSEEQQGD